MFALPTWLAWSAIKGPLLKAAPWIALVIAALIGWHAIAVHYREQGRAESVATIAGYQVSMQRGVDAIYQLETALDDQTKRVKAYVAIAQKAQQDSAIAHAAQFKANASLRAQASALRDVAKRTYSSAEPCSTPLEVMENRK